MGDVLVIRNPVGRQFADLTSFSLIGGVSFGECFLQLSPLLFDDYYMENSMGFGRSYVGASKQAKYDQYCRLSSQYREQIEGYADGITKQVYGISIGISSGGSLSAIGDLVERVGTAAISRLERLLVRQFSNIIRQGVLALLNDGMNAGAGQLTTGISGGFFNMYDGGALHGMNGNSTLDLDFSRINRMNFAVLQLTGGVIIGTGINLLIIGDFPSIRTITQARIGFYFSLEQNFINYLVDLFSRGYCFAFIGDAAIGAILPGIDLNIVAS